MKKQWVVYAVCALLCILFASGALAHELSGREEFGARVMGFLSFINILWALGIGLVVFCFFVLLREWIQELVKLLPKEVYEFVCYFLSVGLVIDAFANSITGPENAHFIALTGCVLFGGSLLFSCYLHNIEMKGTTFSGIMLAVFGVLAIPFQSTLLGFFAVMCLMSLVGFSVWIGHFCYAFGFDGESGAARATATSFMLLAVFVMPQILLQSYPPAVAIFELGALWMGSIVGYLGLLILSFVWYRHHRKISTAPMKLAMLVACIAGIAVGSIWGIGVLKVVALVFLVMFLLELPAEIRPESITGWACIGLFIGIVACLGSLWVKSHMDIVGPWLSFQ